MGWSLSLRWLLSPTMRTPLTSRNFIQRPLPPGGSGTGAPPLGSEATPGALGMGLQVTTTLTTLFTLLGYTTPLVSS